MLEEILRRRNKSEREAPDKQWCDHCNNFRGWRGKPDMIPDDYNPCTKGHEMNFLAPVDYDDPWGFWRRLCPDRIVMKDPKIKITHT